MQFKIEFIPKIINEDKTQTRRLVKEYSTAFTASDKGEVITKIVYTNNNKVKWQVGKTYAVQPGRGKKGVWWCPKCKGIVERVPHFQAEYLDSTSCDCPDDGCHHINKSIALLDARRRYEYIPTNWKPLRIRITGIRKEKLLSISEEDAKKEGFERAKGEDAIEERHLFFRKFWKITKSNLPKNIKKKKLNYWFDALNEWNPEVWVLEFCVVR